MAQLNSEAKGVVKICRSLCTSRKFPPTLKELEKDYKELEGQFPPKCGFPSFYELLRSSEEFTFFPKNGDTLVRAKISSETEHIVQMIRCQKTGKGRGSGFKGPPMSNRSKFMSSAPRPQIKSFLRPNYMAAPPRLLNRNFNNNVMPVRPKERNDGLPVTRLAPLEMPSRQPLEDKSMPKTAPVANLPRTFVAPVLKKTHSSGLLPSQQARLIMPEKPAIIAYNDVDRFNETSTEPNGTPSAAKYTNGVNSNLKTELHQTSSYRVDLQRAASMKPKSSVQGRLQIAQQKGNENPRFQQGQQTQQIQPGFDLWNDNSISSVDKLALYCRAKGCPEPGYTFFHIKEGKGFKFQCRVTVDESAYSTYPDDFDTQELARMETANRAVESIKAALQQAKYPVFSGSDEELVMLLNHLVSKHSAGIFMDKIPDIMIKEYHQTCPTHYKDLIFKNHAKCFSLVKDELVQEYVVLANTEGLAESPPTSIQFVFEPPPLELDWEADTWNLFVTNVYSTHLVWARLIGAKYNALFDEMTTKLISYHSKLKVALEIKLGQYYIVLTSSNFGVFPSRVRVIDVDEQNENARCFFIDNGDELSFNCKNLYDCDPEFLTVPAQATFFSLSGLDIFHDMETVTSCAQALLFQTTVVAEIKSSQKEYLEKQIEVVLWDTSTNVDVNLNEQILAEIKPLLPPVQLNEFERTMVHITGVTPKCEITCYPLGQNGTSVICEALKNIKSSMNLERARGFYQTDDTSDLYLVQNEQTKTWYRAELKDVRDVNHLVVYLVDEATEMVVHKQNIYRLADIHCGWNVYPKQGLRLRLHKVDSLNPQASQLLRGLYQPGSMALTKYCGMGRDNVPEYLVLINHRDRMQVVNSIIVNQLSLQNDAKKPETKVEAKVPVQTTPSAPIVTKDSFHAIEPYPIPNPGEYIEIQILDFITQTRFNVQAVRQRNVMVQMLKNLAIFCRSDKNSKVAYEKLLVGMEYAARYKNDDSWMRVSVLNKFHEDHIMVEFVDTGAKDVIPLRDIRLLPDQFRKISRQAFVAKLHGVKNISPATVGRLIDLTRGKKLMAIVKNIETSNGEEVVVLDILDVMTKSEQTFIRHILITEGLAEIAD